MIDYRVFRNNDPPKLLELWHHCCMGRGAARNFSNDAFDLLVFAQPYFERKGLVVASMGKDLVGFAHAGFGVNDARSALDKSRGVISVVMVRPDVRRKGVGRELVRMAEQYLVENGAKSIHAGESQNLDPFYLGMYGSSSPVGFLESDPNAAPFMKALGYEAVEKWLVFNRDISVRTDPFDPRLINIRRSVELAITDRPSVASWWWMTKQGRLDSLNFDLLPRGGGPMIATGSCWRMVLHGIARGRETVGLHDLFVQENFRRKGYAKALVLEVIRRLRQESINAVELAVGESNVAAIELAKWLGFAQVDSGVAYKKPDSGS